MTGAILLRKKCCISVQSASRSVELWRLGFQSRGVGERAWDWGREKETAIQPALLSLSVQPWRRRGRSCPVPGDAWRAATAVLSTGARKEMRHEKTFLPRAGMRNHGGSHRVVLFVSVITDSHVP
jgi:hypothetical protein